MSLFGDFGTAARGLVFFVATVSVSAAASSGFALDSSELELSVDCDSADSVALVCEAGSLELRGVEAEADEAGADEAGVEVSADAGCFAASVFSAVVECSSCGVMVCESVAEAGGGSVGVCDDEFVELDGAMIASTRCNASVARG